MPGRSPASAAALASNVRVKKPRSSETGDRLEDEHTVELTGSNSHLYLRGWGRLSVVGRSVMSQTTCRGCGSQVMDRVLDLGLQPGSDHFPRITEPIDGRTLAAWALALRPVQPRAAGLGHATTAGAPARGRVGDESRACGEVRRGDPSQRRPLGRRNRGRVREPSRWVVARPSDVVGMPTRGGRSAGRPRGRRPCPGARARDLAGARAAHRPAGASRPAGAGVPPSAAARPRQSVRHGAPRALVVPLAHRAPTTSQRVRA